MSVKAGQPSAQTVSYFERRTMVSDFRKLMMAVLFAVLLLSGCTGKNTAATSSDTSLSASPSDATFSDATFSDAVSGVLGAEVLKADEPGAYAYHSHVSGKWKETGTGWTFVTAGGSTVKGDWICDDGLFYYVNAAGIMEYDEFRMIGGVWYHLGDSGAMDVGRFTHGDSDYLTDENGALYMNTWVPQGDDWYLCGDMGELYKNMITPDGYTVDADGRLMVTNGASLQAFLYRNAGDHELYLNLGTADIIWNDLKKRGWTETAIAGLLGNFQQESGICPTQEEAYYHIGYGLGQWSRERRSELEAYAASCGKAVGDIHLQLDFLCSESGESGYVKRYAKTKWSGPAEAAIDWGIHWERYNQSRDISMSTVRIPYAEAYYAHYVNGVKFLASSTHYDEAAALAAATPRMRKRIWPRLRYRKRVPGRRVTRMQRHLSPSRRRRN